MSTRRNSYRAGIGLVSVLPPSLLLRNTNIAYKCLQGAVQMGTITKQKPNTETSWTPNRRKRKCITNSKGVESEREREKDVSTTAKSTADWPRRRHTSNGNAFAGFNFWCHLLHCRRVHKFRSTSINKREPKCRQLEAAAAYKANCDSDCGSASASTANKRKKRPQVAACH